MLAYGRAIAGLSLVVFAATGCSSSLSGAGAHDGGVQRRLISARPQGGMHEGVVTAQRCDLHTPCEGHGLLPQVHHNPG
jgi:hypothetical protein